MSIRADAGAGRLDRVSLPDRYEIVDHIADGGMASVWRAHDAVLDRAVAIKLLSESYAVDAKAVQRFQREARAAARVSTHANVVTIYDVGVAPPVSADDGRPVPFIVMEYLSGGNVADALALGGGALQADVTIRWLHEAAAALDHAHARGVVHRDIKPANLLLDDTGRLHIADFGVARLVTESTITNVGLVLGTAAYLAPEQIRGRPATDASDRYALAVAGYEMLTGTRPFDTEAIAAGDRLRPRDGDTAGGDDAGDDPPPPASIRNPDLPRAVDAVLARGMAVSPARRWPTAREFTTAIDGAFRRGVADGRRPSSNGIIAASRGPLPRAAQTLQFAPPPVARRRLPQGLTGPLALVALLALVTGIAVGASGGSHPRATAPKPRHVVRHRTRPHAAPRPRAATTSTTSTTIAPASPTAVQARGHQLMLSGDYSAAIADMQHVLRTTPTSDIVHAWALYDLGRSLRLAGDPKAAIPVLEARLHYHAGADVVLKELLLAERAAGVNTNPHGKRPLPPGHDHQGSGRGPGVGPGGGSPSHG
jgi:serine/threonine-protein kinase